MHQVGTEHPWLFRYDFNMMVDFCIWVLERDGLQVSPFDAHPAGDGTLQRAGLQAQEWRSWTSQVVNLQDQQQQAKTGPNASSLFVTDAYDPPTVWSGNAVVRKRLQELWEQYKPLANTRRKWVRPLAGQLRGVAQQLWNDLQTYQTRLPSLTIHFVEYPQQVGYPIPPASIIMTVVDGSLSGEVFRLQTLQFAERLAMAPPS